ncbi:MAG: hypothetical protein AVDCRST_MAG54-2644, partial [uncultured Actinomycetospora sp.]
AGDRRDHPAGRPGARRDGGTGPRAGDDRRGHRAHPDRRDHPAPR